MSACFEIEVVGEADLHGVADAVHSDDNQGGLAMPLLVNCCRQYACSLISWFCWKLLPKVVDLVRLRGLEALLVWPCVAAGAHCGAVTDHGRQRSLTAAGTASAPALRWLCARAPSPGEPPRPHCQPVLALEDHQQLLDTVSLLLLAGHDSALTCTHVWRLPYLEVHADPLMSSGGGEVTGLQGDCGWHQATP